MNEPKTDDLALPAHGSSKGTDLPLQLARESDFLRALMEYSPDAVYFKDRESRFLLASSAVASVFGLGSPDALVGKRDFDFWGAEHAQRAFDDEQEIIRTGHPIIGKTERAAHTDGKIIWALTSKMPLYNSRREIIGTFGISKDITAFKEAEAKVEQLHRQLLDASRRAGMAEVATGVLHNVGNVLNSVNVSTNLLLEGLRKLKLDQLAKLSALLREHATDLGQFMTADPKGRHVVDFLEALEGDLSASRTRLLGEVSSLEQGVGHIREIVTIQQSYAMMKGLVEDIDPADVVEDALKMSQGGFLRHGAEVLREFQAVPKIVGERGKVLQILNNLFSNAKYAVDQSAGEGHTIEIRIEASPNAMVRIVVKDTGVGIPRENLTRIFNQGFTTRKGGHGFGLHSAANAAQSMCGSLIADSDGPGRGATFILELPQVSPTA